MRFSSRAKEHLVVWAVYISLCLLFFKELIFQSQWFGEDFFTQHFPNRNYAAVELSKGFFPLWTPYVFSGMPFFADIQTAVLYPFNLVLSLFVSEGGLPYAVYEYQVVFHLALGGYFMFLFLRDLALDFKSALLGGSLFAFNAFFISHAHHAGMVHAGIWLPLVFYFCRRGFRLAPKWFLGCPVVLVASLFAGHPQVTIYIFYAFTAYFVFMAYSVKISLLQSVSRYGLVVMAFFLLGAIQLLPTFEFLQNTARNILTYGDAVKDSFPLRSVLTLFVKGLYGSSYESWQKWEFSCYVGLGSILLAVFGVMKRLDSEPVFFMFIALLSLLLMLGENTPVYRLFYHLIPGFKFFRVPARFGYLFSFSISILAACGFYRLTTSRQTGSYKTTLGLAVLLLAPGLAALALDFSAFKTHAVKYAALSAITLLAVSGVMRFGDKQKAIQYALILVILADLFFARNLHNQMIMSKDKLDSVLYHSPVAQVLNTATEGSRFFARNKFSSYANLGLVYRRSNIAGYNQFQLKNYRNLNLDSPRTASLLGAELVDYDNFESVDEKWKSAELETRLNFMVNRNTMPRAFIVRRSSPDKGLDLQKALDEGFDPLAMVYLDKEFSSETTEGSSRYAVTRYADKGNEIAVDLESDEKGILVISEVYYPGWRVYVNDVEKEVLRADMLLRAVRVEKGTGHVLFVFRPKSFVIGATLSIISFLALSVVVGGYAFSWLRESWSY